MASFPGSTLEAFVEDALFRPTEAQVQAVVALLEPQREGIELSLDGFEEDEHSWRDYRDGIWRHYVHDDAAMKAAVAAVLAADRGEQDVDMQIVTNRTDGRVDSGICAIDTRSGNWRAQFHDGASVFISQSLEVVVWGAQESHGWQLRQRCPNRGRMSAREAVVYRGMALADFLALLEYLEG